MTAITKAPKPLAVKQITPYFWGVECRSKQHGPSHKVRKSVMTSRLVCDAFCYEYRKHDYCPHTQAVEIYLRGGQPLVTSISGGELFAEEEENSTLPVNLPFPIGKRAGLGTKLESFFPQD